MKHIATALLALSLAMPSFAAKPSLRIYEDKGQPDTVTRATYYLIGITDPGAQAWIDGREAHVYKTGSFGAELTLKKGVNKFEVKVKQGSQTARATRTVVLVDPKPVQPKVAAGEITYAEPIYALTDSGATLQFGNGADRLGGSKMGFLEEGVGLTLTGESGNLYRVRLAEGNYAYINKNDVTLSEKVTPGVVNSGSITVNNMGTHDRIFVSLPKRVAYCTHSEIDPQVIKISLFGVTNNTNWLTQKSTPGIIDFVDLHQEADVLTIYVRLADKYNWGYSVSYRGNNMVIDIRHRPQSLALKDLKIGLDAGHGGPYPGARSPSGLLEKDVNLDIVLKAAEMLRAKGATVVLTRSGDTGPSMTERKRIWRDAAVDLAVSIHNNASGNPLIPMGTSCYYKHIAHRALAQSLHRSMLSAGLTNFGLTGNFNFSLNGPTDYPNALVEVLFMSSLPEEELLADPDYRTELARKVVEGIENYLESAEK